MRLPAAIVLALSANIGLFASVLLYDKAHKRNRHIDHVVLYLQWSNQAQFAGFYVAKEKGFYDNENLDVTILSRPDTFADLDRLVAEAHNNQVDIPRDIPNSLFSDLDKNSSNESDAPVDRGPQDLESEDRGPKWLVPMRVAQTEMSFGIWPGDQILKYFLNSKSSDKYTRPPIKVIGVVFDKSLACFMVRDELAPIVNPSMFEPSRVGVYPDYDTATIFQWLIKKYHPDVANKDPFPLNPNDGPIKQVNKLESGKLDVLGAYVTNEPLVAKRMNVPVLLLTPEDYGITYYSDTIIANPSVMKNKGDIAKRFLRASAEGWRDALRDPNRAADIIVAHQDSNNPLFKDQQLEVLEKLAAYVKPNEAMFAMNPEVWKSMHRIIGLPDLLYQFHC